MRDFVEQHSIVRTIWGDPDIILLIFAGSAAEFALNRAVDWLFFTGRIPHDPVGRLFSTARFAQDIVFADEQTAERTFNRITSIHRAVERERGQSISAWAYRDVLYMLIDYSERAYRLLYRRLTAAEQRELYDVFRRVGIGLQITELPSTYGAWRPDRQCHLDRDLAFSHYTQQLYQAYRRHLGEWRYELLLQMQALLVPEDVGRLLKLKPSPLFYRLLQTYSIFDWLPLRAFVHYLLLPSGHLDEVRLLDRTAL